MNKKLKKLAEMYSDKKTKQIRIMPLLTCAYELGKAEKKITNIYDSKTN